MSEKINLEQVFSSREVYLAFLQEKHRKAYEAFNDTAQPESKSKKWKLLRIEKVIRLIKEYPKYQFGHCFTCKEKLDQQRMTDEPESIWCVECATQHELSMRYRGGHWAFAKKIKGGGCLGEI